MAATYDMSRIDAIDEHEFEYFTDSIQEENLVEGA